MLEATTTPRGQPTTDPRLKTGARLVVRRQRTQHAVQRPTERKLGPRLRRAWVDTTYRVRLRPAAIRLRTLRQAVGPTRAPPTTVTATLRTTRTMATAIRPLPLTASRTQGQQVRARRVTRRSSIRPVHIRPVRLRLLTLPLQLSRSRRVREARMAEGARRSRSRARLRATRTARLRRTQLHPATEQAVADTGAVLTATAAPTVVQTAVIRPAPAIAQRGRMALRQVTRRSGRMRLQAPTEAMDRHRRIRRVARLHRTQAGAAVRTRHRTLPVEVVAATTAAAVVVIAAAVAEVTAAADIGSHQAIRTEEGSPPTAAFFAFEHSALGTWHLALGPWHLAVPAKPANGERRTYSRVPSIRSSWCTLFLEP